MNQKYGEVRGSQPQVLPPPRAGVRTLSTADIKGAEAGSRRLGNFSHHQRKDEPRHITQNEDIDGSKCGTVKKSIITTRNLNPLEPSYQIPGRSETNEDMNDPYGSRGCQMARIQSAVVRSEPLERQSDVKSTHSGKPPSAHSSKAPSAQGSKPPSAAGSRKPPSSAASGRSALSTAQKMDKFIQK